MLQAQELGAAARLGLDEYLSAENPGVCVAVVNPVEVTDWRDGPRPRPLTPDTTMRLPSGDTIAPLPPPTLLERYAHGRPVREYRRTPLFVPTSTDLPSGP
jgi:hypothetical protein